MTTATSAATIPKSNVLAVASENARWIAPTMSGTNGSSCALVVTGAPARMACPRSPTPVRRFNDPAPDAEKEATICGGSDDAASCRGSSSTNREPNTVPAAARPTLPPTCWNRVRLLVAVPICRSGTAPCTTSVKTEKIGPTPMPVTNIHDQRSGSGVSARRFDSRNSPIASTTDAPSARGL